MSSIKSLYPEAPVTKHRLCLLLIAHGSRRQASNEEIKHLTALLRSKTGPHYDQVLCAFLELASPSIQQGLQICIERGATDIVVLPYFLSAGRHVTEDIPQIISEVQRNNRQIRIRTIPYLGAVQEIVDLLAYCAISAEIDDHHDYPQDLCTAP